MNRYLRLIWLLLRSRFRSAVPLLGPCRTDFRVLPTDLDMFMHVNNGIYLTLMDLGRLDLLMRNGMLRRVIGRRWYFVVEAQRIQYIQPLRLMRRFDIETRVLGWDGKAFVLEQRFLVSGPAGGGARESEVAAVATVLGRAISRGRTVPPAEVVAESGFTDEPLSIPAEIVRWTAEQRQQREALRSP